MTERYEFLHYDLKYLPHQAIEDLADILDIPHGGITMARLAEDMNRFYEFQLDIDTNKIEAWCYQHGRRPTVLLFNHLKKHGVTIGIVQYILDEMRAATGDIFQRYHDDIIGLYQQDHPRIRRDRRAPTQNPCSHCSRRNDMHTLSGRCPSGHLSPGHPRSCVVPSFSPRNMVPWVPPDTEVCPECLRLLDEDETEVLTPHWNDNHTCRTGMTTNNLSRPAMSLGLPQHERNIGIDIRERTVSYTENPSESCDLRSAPDGISNTRSSLNLNYKDNATDSSVQNCTCKKPQTKPVCTCRNDRSLKKQISVPSSSSTSSESSNRWSNPLPSSGLLARSSSTYSSSDPEISHQPHHAKSGVQIFISYTDDVKTEVIELAGELKNQGHAVKTDLQRKSFYLAREQGLVSEKDEYSWLSKKYHQSKFIIVCSSKGYLESLNMHDAIPSPQYLNARYIYEMICHDPQKSEKVIEVCFAKTLYTTNHRHCLRFAKQYILPQQMSDLLKFLRE